MLNSLDCNSSGEPSLSEDVKVHKSQVSESRTALLLPEPFDKGVINFPADDKVLGKHEEDTLVAEVKYVI